MNKAYLALITGLLLIGLSPILIKSANAPGIVTSFYRLAIGTVVLTIPFLWSVSRRKLKMSARGITYAVLGGICFSLDMAFWTTGIVATNATIPTLTGNLAPVWVGIGAMLFFKERQRIGFWIGLILTFSGVTSLAISDIIEATGMMKGIFLGLLAGVFYALYQLITQPGRKHLDTLAYLFISSLSCSVFLAAYAFFLGYSFTGYDQTTWVLFIIMGISMQAGAWFLINYSQGFIPASVVSPTLLLQPVLTAIIAMSFLNEPFTLGQIIAGIVVVAGVYLVYFSRLK